jgi:hypothetical protein
MRPPRRPEGQAWRRCRRGPAARRSLGSRTAAARRRLPAAGREAQPSRRAGRAAPPRSGAAPCCTTSVGRPWYASRRSASTPARRARSRAAAVPPGSCCRPTGPGRAPSSVARGRCAEQRQRARIDECPAHDGQVPSETRTTSSRWYPSSSLENTGCLVPCTIATSASTSSTMIAPTRTTRAFEYVGTPEIVTSPPTPRGDTIVRVALLVRSGRLRRSGSCGGAAQTTSCLPSQRPEQLSYLPLIKGL